MNAMLAMRQYQNVGTQSQVADASPHRLIQMLMEGGLSRMAQAKGAMERGQTAQKGELMGKSIAIIGGLRAAVDLKQGGSLAERLDQLYEYMMVRLSEANQNNDAAALDEVMALLREVKSGWDAIDA